MSRLSTEEFAKVWGTLKSLQTKQLVAIQKLVESELGMRRDLELAKESTQGKTQ